MTEEEKVTCVICDVPLDNPKDELCALCADDIRTEEGAPVDEYVIDPATAKVYAPGGVDLGAIAPPNPPDPDPPES